MLPGRVSGMASAADPKSRLFEVEVSIDNASSRLKPGMVAALQLTAAGESAPVAVLPLSAVVRPNNAREGFAVYALDEGHTPPTVHLREVELGAFLGNSIPVQRGLRAGEKVVVQGAALLSDSEQVRVIP